MRRLNGKRLMMLIALFLSVCLPAAANPAAGGWTVNPSDYRYDMSFYFNVGLKASESMESFEVGAFVGDECRGVAEKLDLPENGCCQYMRIRSNSPADQREEIVFKLRNKTTGETFELSGEENSPFYFEPDSMLGLPSKPFMMYRLYSVKVAAAENGSVEFSNGKYPENASLNVVAVPTEGYHFEKWSDGITDSERTLIVTEDIDLTAYFAINTYKAVFKVGDDVVATLDVEYGSAITAPEAPALEGYTFAGWSEIPATMPAKDIEVNGSYTVNSYKAVFKVGDDVVATLDVEYGSAITAPEAPAREGYTFAGWSEIPATMPAKDIEVNGSYTVNSYKAVFKVGDDVVATLDVEYGSAIIAPEAPAREGYTFAGWSEIPATMPAKDIEVNGSYTVNSYKAVFKVGDDVVATLDVEYGSAITAPEAPAREGYTFAGWSEIPATMPAKDIEINGSYTVNSYKAVFKIGDDVVATLDVEYGSAITAPEAPVREGYTFAGWSEIPATMPAKDIEVNGSYTVNSYKAVFKVGDDVVATLDVEYGSAITVPEAPAREGHTFAGWDEIPETMPAKDIEVNGSYTVNSYKVVFKVGDDVVATLDIEYGSAITAPEAPAREGYTFAGWSEIPATMPAKDIEVNGSYTVNSYKAVFKVGDDVVATLDVEYGSAITAPEAPAREGYTFAGWSEIPATMPAKDIEINGSYTVNTYKVVFKVGDDVVATLDVEYGSAIIAPEAPAREGYTFAGWSEIPATMPAKDIEINGSYTVNTYTLTVYLDDEVYMVEEIEYGASIEIPVPEVPADKIFDGWKEEIPETMPAYDVEIHGTTSDDMSSVGSLITSEHVLVTVYNLRGVLLYKDKCASEVMPRLTPGIYIINGKKVMVR